MPCVLCECVRESIFGSKKIEDAPREAQKKQKSYIEMMDLELVVIQAEGLAIKDHAMGGLIPMSSDPYVEVRLYPEGDETPVDEILFLGKTEVREKNLSPHWDETFSKTFRAKDVTIDAYFLLTFMDCDQNEKKSNDDLMGRVKVPCHTKLTRMEETTWHPIPPDSADGEEASGKVECTFRAHRYKKEREKEGEGSQEM